MNEKIGIVVSDFNADITHVMERLAIEHVKFLGGEVVKVIHVPGVFDMPLAVKFLLDNKEIKSENKIEVDGVVTLGAVIEGDTDHDNIVATNAARKIADLSVGYNKPVSLGVSGPKMSRADGIKRLDGYAKRSVESCFKMLKALKA
ncbi:MAG: 6,7-dimethyl-8-ribityllumazine synthase [Candidatus Woesearchaeota archaeon]